MNKVLRVTVLSGALALLASPLFAYDPGGSDPPPPPPSSSSTMATSSATTAVAIATLLAYFGL